MNNYHLLFSGVIQGIFMTVMIMAIVSPVVFIVIKLFCCFWLLADGFVWIGSDKTLNEILGKVATNE